MSTDPQFHALANHLSEGYPLLPGNTAELFKKDFIGHDCGSLHTLIMADRISEDSLSG